MDSRSQQPTAAVNQLTLTPVFTLEGHEDTIPSISYFPGGKRIISGSSDMTTRQWDLEAGEEIEEARGRCMRHVKTLGVSRDGRWVVSAGWSYAGPRVCEVETGIVRTFKDSSKEFCRMITCIDISADSTLLAGAGDSTVWIWSLETGKIVVGPFKSANWAEAVRFSHDSKKLALKSRNSKEVWNVQTQKLDVSLKMEGSVKHTYERLPVFWTTKNTTIVTEAYQDSTRATIYEFDASTLKTVGAPFGHHTDITGLALSLDCALLICASTSVVPTSDTIKLWAFESRQLLASFNVVHARLLFLSPDSRQLVYTGLGSNNIYVCNTPPEILASIQPVLQVRTNAPRNLPLADASALSRNANQSTILLVTQDLNPGLTGTPEPLAYGLPT
ncbi:quinon protein alcohol dehydrogenase-like superfamily [Suillus subalutaceus]|uniref:quinon protein alcohol dehydrogenase-like superfamily n=1 Tax=Suillus subalutaceus TaxID=48586 RepID=UPI001B8853C3|nr:quinon protein alcohol dehydrogenase-like superfamily [Suillus subalutaceus]KAG1873603.1 quinon protein alcohol dehydrogenase-like superfamily [Suillus subalutaceus]